MNILKSVESILLRKLVSVLSSLKNRPAIRNMVSIGALFAFVGFLSDSSSIISFVNQLRGEDKAPLTVVRARLKPFRISPVAPENQDDVFVQLQLRNYGNDPVYLTSAKIEVTKSNTAKVGKAAVTGMCALTDNPNANTPIKVEPGASIWVRVSDSIHLQGLSAWLTEETLKDIHVPTPEDPFTITENFFVDEVNRKFGELYGPNAALKVTVYSGNRKELQTFSFRLAEGKDIFSKDGSLQQDWFIANWMYPRWRPAGVGASCEDEPS